MAEGIIISPPPPNPPINWDRWLSVGALAVSLGAALFVGLQYQASSRQARAAEAQVRIALQARDDAKQAAKDQADDVRRARGAAEKSADAAQKLANGMERSARAAESSAEAGRTALGLNRRALILSNTPTLQIFNTRLAKPLNTTDVPAVTTRIFNGGKGTAYKAQVQQWFKVARVRAFTYEVAPDPPSTADLAAGTGSMLEINSKLTSALTADSLKLIEARQLVLYVYGRAVYYDNTLDKPTKYTWYWCNYYSAIDDGSDKLLFGICPEHNYTTVE